MHLHRHALKSREVWLQETCRYVDRFLENHPNADAAEVSLLAQAAADFIWQQVGSHANWHTVNRTALRQDAEAHFGDPVFSARLVGVVDGLTEPPPSRTDVAPPVARLQPVLLSAIRS